VKSSSEPFSTPNETLSGRYVFYYAFRDVFHTYFSYRFKNVPNLNIFRGKLKIPGYFVTLNCPFILNMLYSSTVASFFERSLKGIKGGLYYMSSSTICSYVAYGGRALAALSGGVGRYVMVTGPYT
jgi:hypothetical protein